MRSLKTVYLTANGDKTLLSARLATRPDGRHAIVTRLAGMDWQKMTPVLMRAIRDGEVFIVGGEDARIDPAYNRRQLLIAILNIIDASDGKTARGFGSSNRDMALVKLGSGCLILYRNGPDSTDGTPAKFAEWHKRFLQSLDGIFREDGTFESGVEDLMMAVNIGGWFPLD